MEKNSRNDNIILEEKRKGSSLNSSLGKREKTLPYDNYLSFENDNNFGDF